MHQPFFLGRTGKISGKLWPKNWPPSWWLSPFGETHRRFVHRIYREGRYSEYQAARDRMRARGLTKKTEIDSAIAWQFVPKRGSRTWKEAVKRGVLDPNVDYRNWKPEDEGIDYGPNDFVGTWR